MRTTPDEAARLKQQIKARAKTGMSYTKIAAELGVTRNVVIGHAHRMGLVAGRLGRPPREKAFKEATGKELPKPGRILARISWGY